MRERLTIFVIVGMRTDEHSLMVASGVHTLSQTRNDDDDYDDELLDI